MHKEHMVGIYYGVAVTISIDVTVLVRRTVIGMNHMFCRTLIFIRGNNWKISQVVGTHASRVVDNVKRNETTAAVSIHTLYSTTKINDRIAVL